MGLLDLFRPRWKHSDPSVRAEAIKDLSPDDLPRLSQVARHDSDPRIRRIALKKINDPDLLGELSQHDPDEGLRRDAAEKANELLLAAALAADNEARSLAVTERLSAQRSLVEVACRAAHPNVRQAAFARLSEERFLVEVARRSTDSELRLSAVERIKTPEALRDLLLLEINKEIGQRAISRLNPTDSGERAILTEVAQRARNKSLRTWARERLGMAVVKGSAAPEQAAAAADTESDAAREKGERLCQRLEVAAKSTDPEDFVDADEEIARVRAEWQAIADELAVALRKRFDRALSRFQERRDVLLKKQPKTQGPAVKPAPVLRLPPAARNEAETEKPAIAEKAPAKRPAESPAETPAVLPPHEDSEEKKRAEAARARKEEERKQREAEQAERRRLESEKRAAEEKARAEAQERNLARVEEHCARLEQMAQAETLRPKQVEQALKQAHDVMVQANPLPRDRATQARKRYDAARAALVIKLHDFRENEDWQRWANLPRLEALCQKIEALAAALEGGAPRNEVASQLKTLQAEWKTVGPAPKEKSEALWQRFKEKGDQIFDKLRASTEEERAQNLTKKEALCEKVEALHASLATLTEASAWKGIGEQLKALQTEWKAVGSVPTREQADALWQRFKTAADKVYAEQKAHYQELDEERSENLKKKEALCQKIEAVVMSTDWKGTAELIKSYQADWKAIGPAPRAEQEALWQRFRAACDKFFERRQAAFDKLDEERQAHLKQKEALCEQAEVLAQKEELDQEAGEAEIKRLQSEWKRIGPVPQQQAEALWQRFRAACEKVFTRGRQYEAQLVQEHGGQAQAKFSNKLPLEGVLLRLQETEDKSNQTDETPSPKEAPTMHRSAGHSWEDAAACGWEDIDRVISGQTPEPEDLPEDSDSK